MKSNAGAPMHMFMVSPLKLIGANFYDLKYLIIIILLIVINVVGI